MKIFLLVLLGLIVWFISAILSSLIAKKFFLNEDENFWAFVCTLFAPAALIVLLIISPFYFLYELILYFLEK